MTFNLVIYHNLDTRFFEFTPGDMFRPTDRIQKVMAAGELPDVLLENVPRLLDSIYAQLNIDAPDTDWAKSYRGAGHRSLSVGDVIQVGETAWAVANMGFKPVSILPEQVVNLDTPADVSFSVPRSQEPWGLSD